VHIETQMSLLLICRWLNERYKMKNFFLK